MEVLLLSTFELGRQPFGLASAAAFLRAAGARVRVRDLAVEDLDEAEVRGCGFVAFFVPMHTATRLALRVLKRVQELNPGARTCFFGLYAPVNEAWLRESGVDVVLGGEFEEGLVVAWKHGGVQARPVVSLAKQRFPVPDRSGLPGAERYAKLVTPEGERLVAYVEASRGCKHLCRHCPVVPVYGGRFRTVAKEVVLADIEQQVAAGAQHVTFGDPDFLNGVGHALAVVRELHALHPEVTYDVTVKVEHLREHTDVLPELVRTGCAFVTTAVESVDDAVLRELDKGHTREDFRTVLAHCRAIGLRLAPTFVPFTPWTTLDSYVDLLELLVAEDLAGAVAPVQLTIRLLIPDGSLLQGVANGAFDKERLTWQWRHTDPRVDELQRSLESFVGSAAARAMPRSDVFRRVQEVACAAAGREIVPTPVRRDPVTIPFMTEPWY